MKISGVAVGCLAIAALNIATLAVLSYIIKILCYAVVAACIAVLWTFNDWTWRVRENSQRYDFNAHERIKQRGGCAKVLGR